MNGDQTTIYPTYPKTLKKTMSTPAADQRGCTVQLELVKLATYIVNVRSFHPNKKFERLGFRFDGDNRGFSLDKSFHSTAPVDKVGETTSRIWQSFDINLNAFSALHFERQSKKSRFTASNTSSGPGWATDGPEHYVDPEYRPRGEVLTSAFPQTHCGEQNADITTWYGGENFAFIGARKTKELTGATVVPTLDVFLRLSIKVERIRKWMDITVLAYGDAFPNCEAFIQDAKGNKIFLGTHVRIGTPASHLAGVNKRIMFANVIRVAVDDEGNFGSRLWVFTQALGATPDERDDYPAIRDIVLPSGSTPYRLSDVTYQHNKLASSVTGSATPINLPGLDRIAWPAEPIATLGDGTHEDIVGKQLHISAYEDIDAVWAQLKARTKKPPSLRDTTVQSWNEYHLHRNPNQGRSPDEEDLDESKWKK